MPVHSPPVRSRGSIEDMVHRAIALVAAGMAALTSFAVVVALVTGKGPSRGDLGPAIDLDRGRSAAESTTTSRASEDRPTSIVVPRAPLVTVPATTSHTGDDDDDTTPGHSPHDDADSDEESDADDEDDGGDDEDDGGDD